MRRTIYWIWLAAVTPLVAEDNPLIGDWALTLPTKEAGWLSVRQGEAGALQADLLWAVGSARAVADLRVEDRTLHFTRKARRPATAKDTVQEVWDLTARAEGDQLRLQAVSQLADSTVDVFFGKRLPPLPPAPNLSKVAFGEAVALFNGRDLTGWRPTDASKKNGWSARDGVLRNDTPKTDFSAYGDHANLRTEAEFEDFQLHVEFRLPPEGGGNSGLYLRGLYEVQVTHRDSSMQGISGPGALFGRILPATNAGKPAGEWESYDITLVDRHVTVVQNGTKVIDNQPVAGPTGGALHADVTSPGPLMLQGDHTSVEYRNFQIRPRLK